MIRRLLVPNRGEIAIRIARTAREMGIESVLAFAQDDENRFVRHAFDEAVSLGTGDARATYLNVGKIIELARTSSCDAIHPGYGFLSERAELALACERAGIIFVGPRSKSIELMGSKSGSRRLMQRLGVPVVPGYHGDQQSDDRLVKEAGTIGFPLLVKASGGGGGKGMKIVREDAQLRPAIESARREALKAFGDDRLLLERYIEQPRHIEFQVFGDTHGTIVHLFERDCSIQRRHQKIIEESPAPRYPDELRQRMAAAAVAAAAGAQYSSAGTVEFIVTPANDFYFLEMNTRLQVEHPVTELVLGMDLVRLQLDVASGRRLPFTQAGVSQRGHAIECRIYAEDPAEGFLPQSGTIGRYREPAGPGIRVDSGFGEGSHIGVHYDPMIAKLVCSAGTRSECIDRILRALSDFVVLGLRTNIAYLSRIISNPAFREGLVSTRFVIDHEDELRDEEEPAAPAIAAILAEKGGRQKLPEDSTSAVMPTVWDLAGDWGR